MPAQWQYTASPPRSFFKMGTLHAYTCMIKLLFGQATSIQLLYTKYPNVDIHIKAYKHISSIMNNIEFIC